MIRRIGANLSIILCLVAAVAAVDRPGLSIDLILAVLAWWVFPALWKTVMGIQEVRVQL